jgi:hypothetical protein
MTRGFYTIFVALVALATAGCYGPGDPHACMCLVNFDDERAGLFFKAADEWHHATGGRVALSHTMVDTPAACPDDSVHVHLVRDLHGTDGAPAVGSTDPDREWIKLDIGDEWLPIFRITALHELGHYLTTGGDAHDEHSSHPDDVMYVGGWTEQQSHLTARDIARFE